MDEAYNKLKKLHRKTRLFKRFDERDKGISR